MPVTVGVNGMSVVHKDSGGLSVACPDCCKLQTPVAVVILPLPNMASSKKLSKGSKKVSCDQNPVALADSVIAETDGDQAGPQGGVASGKIKGKAELTNTSFDVKIEGKGTARAMDPVLHNDKNTPPAPLVQGPVVVVEPAEKGRKICVICDHEFD